MIRIAAGAALVYAGLVEPRWLQHVRRTIRIPHLPPELDGFRCHLVADLHSTKFGGMERRIRGRLIEDPVDAVFALGDYVWLNSSPRHAIRVFEGLPSVMGVFAVLGNAEHKRRVNTCAIVSSLEEAGVRVLNNAAMSLARNGCRFTLAGTDDAYSGHANPGLLMEAVIAAEQRAGADRPFRILLTHAPQYLAMPDVGEFDVVFAGHTHGGQVRLPIIGGLLGHSAVEYRLSAGHFTPDRLRRILRTRTTPHLYVSRGVGTGFVRLRFFCRPEIATITLLKGG